MHRREWLAQTATWGASALGVGWSRPSRAQEALPPSAAPEPPLLELSTLGLDSAGVRCRTTSGALASLTLEPKLQQCADDLLRAAHPLTGAALLLDATTGRLLAFSNYVRGQQHVDNPLTTPVPAASVFKLVTTAALLDGGRVDPRTRVCFSGGERQIERHHLEPPPHVDTCPPFLTALGFSRNAVFAQLATQHLLRSELLAKAEALGFNRPLPFDAAVSVGSLELPYNDLEFARAASGFVGSTLTPVGAAHLALSVANQGRPLQMRLIDEAGAWVNPRTPQPLPRVFTSSTAWRMTRMMEVTVHSGTSLEAFSRPDSRSYLGPIRVAGKTGTLQRGKSAPTTSWFTGFAPSRAPKVVVTVMLQNSVLWRRKANEVARDLLRAYFAGTGGITHPFEEPSNGITNVRPEGAPLEE